eukprot:CAMPEP_0170558778 /NCGR_PEP_ID=MMETSP0211-20121228/37752_1 /TAXON_ID=311385 /ORGANISM="Pseudokeronopsis sp., Strain OXSARD2" /LENGTH=69 /DNA_ID=CAMNT_0010871053 /DNA_START=234 /DNA_END=443 /DNA_ORIENTATION=+
MAKDSMVDDHPEGNVLQALSNDEDSYQKNLDKSKRDVLVGGRVGSVHHYLRGVMERREVAQVHDRKEQG